MVEAVGLWVINWEMGFNPYVRHEGTTSGPWSKALNPKNCSVVSHPGLGHLQNGVNVSVTGRIIRSHLFCREQIWASLIFFLGQRSLLLSFSDINCVWSN